MIGDSFNATREKDDFLDGMLKYRCRILFTTRSRYENQISLEVKELPIDTLLALMGKFYDVEKKIGSTKDGRNKKAAYSTLRMKVSGGSGWRPAEQGSGLLRDAYTEKSNIPIWAAGDFFLA